jgi:hypothetical protein
MVRVRQAGKERIELLHFGVERAIRNDCDWFGARKLLTLERRVKDDRSVVLGASKLHKSWSNAVWRKWMDNPLTLFSLAVGLEAWPRPGLTRRLQRHSSLLAG